MTNSTKIVYLLLHFPYLTETFVAEEIAELRQQGMEIQIASLLAPGPGEVQPLSQTLQQDTWYAPGVTSRQGWSAQLYFLRHHFFLYFSLLFTLLRQPYPEQPHVVFAKRLVIFFKAVATARWLQQHHEDAEVIHSHFAWLSGAAAWICSRLLARPYTVTVHAYDLYQATDLLGLVCRNANHIVAISDYNRQHLLQLGYCDESAISVIHCGTHFSQTTMVEKWADEPDLDQPIRLISVGSLNLKKGHTYLIEACRLLRERGLNLQCTIIGTGTYRDALTQQIEAHGLSRHVKLLGALPHPKVLQAYQDHDIFVLAARVAPNGDRDGIPVVMMEAAASGLPLVSTQVSGIPELVQHEKTGLLSPPEDPEALANAIERLADDPQLRHELGANAFALAQREFKIETNVVRLQRMFRQCVPEWEPAPSAEMSPSL